MDWFQSLDVALFRLVNETLINPFFDWLMPVLSGHRLFIPALVLLAASLICRGGRRGRVLVCLLLLVIAVNDGVMCRTLKELVDRPRPFLALPDARLLIGRGGSGSMPSSHAANWFAATAVAFLLYRRSWRFMVPMAAAVSYSRIYNGVHYPSDVIAGAVLGAGCGIAVTCAIETLWRWAGAKWFPLWWKDFPSLINPSQPATNQSPEKQPEIPISSMALDGHWLRLGYLAIGVLFIARLAYLASGKIELSEDEAYQWLWAKHPALYYFSKPPLIAYTQWLGTTLWGDNAFGVRFFSPVIAAVLSVLLLRFMAREVNVRAGFWLVLIVSATPILAVGSTLMTVDPLSVLFWVLALLSAWRAIQTDSTRQWLWTGVWIGLGFLAKYPALVQWPCLMLFLIVWPPVRAQLRRPGPYLALLVSLLSILPGVIWNSQHGWPTAAHLVDRAGLSDAWRPTSRFLTDFLVQEFALCNPIFFVATIWAAIAFWRRMDGKALSVYLYILSVPLFLGCFAYTLRARVQPNWVAPSIPCLLCLMVIHWDGRWRDGSRAVKCWLIGGVALGLTAVILLHDTSLISRLTGKPLPRGKDPLDRVHGWREAARIVEQERQVLLKDGKPAFIIGFHYGITGLLSFYDPEARAGVPDHPIVFYQSTEKADNQFYFWPGYNLRKGQNAIFVEELGRDASPQPPPARLVKGFGTLTDLGTRDIIYKGKVIHTLRLFACRDLK